MADRETRAVEAADMFQRNTPRAQVAEKLGVSRQCAHRWYRKWQEKREEGLKRIGRPGRESRTTELHLDYLVRILTAGPKQFGYEDGRWTLSRIASVWQKQHGVRYSRAQVSRILRRLGWQYSKAHGSWVKPKG